MYGRARSGLARRLLRRRKRAIKPTTGPTGLIGNAFAILNLLLAIVSALATAVLWMGLALLSMIGAGASWHADLFGLLFTAPFLVLELTVIGSVLAAIAHVDRWRARWILQALALAPLAVVSLWLASICADPRSC